MSRASQRRTPRRRLITLWEALVNKPDMINEIKEGHVADEMLEKYQIKRIYCDFERLGDEHVNLSLSPPILFKPLDPASLQKHRVDQNAIGSGEEEAEDVDFRDYDPPRDPEDLMCGFWSALDCAEEVFRYLDALIDYFPRIEAPSGLLAHYKIKSVHLPNPLLWGTKGLDGFNPKDRESWWTRQMREYAMENDVLVHPHIILTTVHSYNGKDGSILFGELASIVTAMRNRADQPKIDENGEELLPRQLQFENEERFPVLLVSLFGQQHGRMLYACMDGGELVIRQSRIFSFERKESAPWDLFTRVLVSRPLKEQ